MSENNVLKKCPKCGAEYTTDEYTFCPECGATLIENEPIVRSVPAVNPPQPKKKMSTKKKGIIGAIVAAVIIAAVAWAGITAPQHLALNSDQDMKVSVGETIEVSAYAEGLTDEDYSQIQWAVSNGAINNNGDGTFTVKYDKNDFIPGEDEYKAEDLDENSYDAYVDAELKKGIRSWNGSMRLIVSLEPKKVKSGKIIHEPDAPKDSQIAINSIEDLHSYFYLKSTTSEENDISFTVKKDDSITVPIPCDTYEIYEADGATWYGKDALFGPATKYVKWEDELTFTEQDYWTLTLQTENGNVNTENLDPKDFPDAE